MAEQMAKLLLTCEETGRLGGLMRARKLTPEQRREIARRAACARWAKKNGAPDPPPSTDPQGPQRDQQWAEAGIMLNSRRKPAVPVSVTTQPGGGRAAA
jgi:hypothetical protein